MPISKPAWTAWPFRIAGLGLIVALLAMVATAAIELLSGGGAGVVQSSVPEQDISVTGLAYTIFVWLIIPATLFIWANIRAGKEFNQRLTEGSARNHSDPVRVGIALPVPSVRSKLQAESAKVTE